MGHFVKQYKLLIFSSFFKRIPSDFLVKISNKNSLLAPVAIQAASFCILSSSCFSYNVQLSHMTSPYSDRDLINAM